MTPDRSLRARPLPGRGRALATRFTDDSLLHNSAFGVGITAVNALFGFIFWLVSARLFTAYAVGLASALTVAMSLASTVSNMGVGVALIDRLPSRRSALDWSTTVNAALVVSLATGLAAGIVTAVTLPVISPGLEVVWTSPAYGLAFVIGVALWTVATTLDFLFVAERRVKFGFIRNTVFSVGKLVLVVIAGIAVATPLALFGSWTVGLLISIPVGLVLVKRLSHAWMPVFRGLRGETRSTMASMLGHHVINLGGALPMYVLPLVVTARLGIVESGWAYIGWTVGSFALVISPTVAASLFAEGSHDPRSLAHHVRRSIVAILALLVPMAVAAVVLGREVLSVFGDQYAENSYGIVVGLALSAFPDAVTNVYVTTLRVKRQLRAAGLLNMAMALLATVVAWFVVPSVGVSGIAWAWLIAQSAGALYALVRMTSDPEFDFLNLRAGRDLPSPAPPGRQ